MGTSLHGIWMALLLASVASAQHYRLPKALIPEHYTLEIFTHLDDEFTFNGNVLIKLKCLQETHNITLHATHLEIPDSKVVLRELTDKNETEEAKKDASSVIPITRHTFDAENEFYILDVDKPLVKGNTYELFIPFHGVLAEGLAGYYRSSYIDRKTGNTQWLAVTQFESIDARRAFPCFDEPEMKAAFRISLGHRDNYTSISNMPIMKTTKVEDKPGWVVDHYQDSVKMSTYLVAFMVSDFDYKTPPDKFVHDNVTFKIWARKDALNQADFAANVGPQYLKFYEEFFNIKYPLPKQDMVAIPDFSAGAMENWGLITYRETALLYDPVVSSASSKHRIASVIAHELAHQWFGNLVTMKWWTDLWLNEGFATYMAAKAVHHVNPEWNAQNEENVENMLSVYSLDSLLTSHPISAPIGHPSEIPQIFDAISYQKGSYILRMMNLFLGEDVFRQGLTNYLNKYAYGNAEQDDLWNSLTEEAHKQKTLSPDTTVKNIMDTWTLQTGFPIISVIRDYDNHKATVSQKRFVKGLFGRTTLNETCWWVPLSYTTASEGDFNSTQPKNWLKCDKTRAAKSTEIELPGVDEWVLFNIKSAGLYKVNYDVQNWELLINALLEDEEKKIPVLNRVQLIDDSMDLAATGHLDYSIALKLLTYLVKESEYLAWSAALDHLSVINSMLKRRPNYGLFKNYVNKIITPIYEKVAYELADKSADAVKRQVLISAWACRFEVGDCEEQSTELYRQWMISAKPDETNPIPKDLRGVVYCTAIRNGGEKQWDFLWQRYLKSNVGSEKSTILQSLGCTKEIWILNRYLDWSLSDKNGIRKQDAVSVFSSVARNNVGFFLAKDFLKARVEEINTYLGRKTNRLDRYLKVLARQMINHEELGELEDFSQRKARFLVGAKLGVQQSIEKVKINIQWQDKYYDNINKLLEKYTK